MLNSTGLPVTAWQQYFFENTSPLVYYLPSLASVQSSSTQRQITGSP